MSRDKANAWSQTLAALVLTAASMAFGACVVLQGPWIAAVYLLGAAFVAGALIWGDHPITTGEGWQPSVAMLSVGVFLWPVMVALAAAYIVYDLWRAR